MCTLEEDVREAKADVKWLRNHMVLKDDFDELGKKVDQLSNMVNLNKGKTDTVYQIVMGKVLEGGVISGVLIAVLKISGTM